MKGHITRRGKASWRLKFDVPSDDGGRQTRYVTVRCATSRRRRPPVQRLAAVGRGTSSSPASHVAEHVRARIDVWHSAGDIGDYTASRYRDMLRLYIADHIGGTALQRLGIADVEKWHGALRSAGLGAGTIRNVHTVLTRALRDGVRHGLIARSVAGRDGETAPTYAPAEMKIIKKDELDDVVASLRQEPIYPEAVLALFCGLQGGRDLGAALGCRRPRQQDAPRSINRAHHQGPSAVDQRAEDEGGSAHAQHARSGGRGLAGSPTSTPRGSRSAWARQTGCRCPGVPQRNRRPAASRHSVA